MPHDTLEQIRGMLLASSQAMAGLALGIGALLAALDEAQREDAYARLRAIHAALDPEQASSARAMLESMVPDLIGEDDPPPVGPLAPVLAFRGPRR